MDFKDETMNLFKLKLYNWNVNVARKRYKNDEQHDQEIWL